MESYEETQIIAAQELAFSWESVKMPLDEIALLHMKLQEKLEIEQGENACLANEYADLEKRCAELKKKATAMQVLFEMQCDFYDEAEDRADNMAVIADALGTKLMEIKEVLDTNYMGSTVLNIIESMMEPGLPACDNR